MSKVTDVESDAMSEGISVDLEINQVVRIVCEKQSGSGVVYDISDGQLVVVTAAHVLEGAESAEVVWTKSETAKKTVDASLAEDLKVSSVKATELTRVAGLDLAFLRVDDAETERAGMKSGSASKESDSMELIFQGYDQAGELLEIAGTMSESWIYVEDFQSHMMIGNAKAAPGMSGGGVFDSNGYFVGIICGMDDAGNVAILPASVIEAEYGLNSLN